MVMKNSIFWVITPCITSKFNRSFGGARRHVPPKRQLIFNGLHGVISQKTEILLKIKFIERGDEPPGSIKCWEVLE
jgi:hypothetical protein